MRPIKIKLQAFENVIASPLEGRIKADLFQMQETRESRMPKGTVKWFNNAKGYGFIIEDGHSEDLFAHFSSIQMEGYKTLKAGQAVCFDKQAGDKGFHAVNITAAEISKPNAGIDVDHDEFISVDEPATNSFQTESANSESQESVQTIEKTATA